MLKTVICSHEKWDPPGNRAETCFETFYLKRNLYLKQKLYLKEALLEERLWYNTIWRHSGDFHRWAKEITSYMQLDRRDALFEKERAWLQHLKSWQCIWLQKRTLVLKKLMCYRHGSWPVKTNNLAISYKIHSLESYRQEIQFLFRTLCLKIRSLDMTTSQSA